MEEICPVVDLAIPFPPQELTINVLTIYSQQFMKQDGARFLWDLANPTASQSNGNLGRNNTFLSHERISHDSTAPVT